MDAADRDGAVPLLVDHTQEDREAKGLRKLVDRDAATPPVHDTVLDAAAAEPLLLLSGPSGCGKSVSLRALALRLRETPQLALPVPRNDAGDTVTERWHGPAVRPVLVTAEGPATLDQLIRDLSLPQDALLIIDAAERLGAAGEALLADAAALARTHPTLRVIVAADADAARVWRIPPGWTHRRIVPLIEAQRIAIAGRVRPGTQPQEWAGIAPGIRANAALFTLWLETGAVAGGSAPAAVDRWLAEVGDARRLRAPFWQRQLAAARLAEGPAERFGEAVRHDPIGWLGPVATALERLRTNDPARLDTALRALVGEGGDFGTVAAAPLLLDEARRAGVDRGTRRAIATGLVRIVEEGRLPPALRREAGIALAVDGDPRDLEALVPIAGGAFRMGSETHPNSVPVHEVVLAPFRIGRYPVVNRLYAVFADATGRAWRSVDGRLARRANAPAVDLSWHDARACCDWLTARWRAEGRIGAAERVRLPTEAEWERAARGRRAADGLVFPWEGAWQPDRSNAEEAGFNDTCPVGLFPLGRSADGCDDMAGQVWEWTSTLWGRDMAVPDFRYPFVADDGRENAAAPADVRRVLRGASFVSPREKANCTYRGSLEPAGFWRGNGFRVVVAPA